MKVNVKLMT